MLTEVSIATSAPERMSMRVNSGSARSPARLLRRGALTEIATGSSSSRNRAMSMSCTAVSVSVISRGEMWGRGRIAVPTLKDEGRADRARLDRLLHCPILRIEAAHEPDLHEAAPKGDLGVDDRRTVRRRGRKRLLAEHRLAGLDRRQHVGCVGRAPGGDDDGVDLLGDNQVFARRVTLRSGQSRSYLLRLARVDVADRNHARSGEHGRQPTNVVPADHPDADDANVYCHELVLFGSSGRRDEPLAPESS